MNIVSLRNTLIYELCQENTADQKIAKIGNGDISREFDDSARQWQCNESWSLGLKFVMG